MAHGDGNGDSWSNFVLPEVQLGVVITGAFTEYIEPYIGITAIVQDSTQHWWSKVIVLSWFNHLTYPAC